ncbi:MAG: glycoside hydrolase family 27 protein [Bacteroidales bacterium]|nr:glycoside hydrolase family 27 protein [Bacteroidales bacterium]
MKIKNLLLAAFALSGMAASAADYDVIIEGMPAGFQVQIAGKTFSENTEQTHQKATVAVQQLTRDQISTMSSGGWIPTITVDDANHQVAISYAQMFEPATDVDAPGAKDYCIYESGNAVYLKFMSPNLVSNGFTGDRFIFVEDGTTGKYFIYNKSAGHYITYTQTTDNQKSTKLTSESVVQYTTDKAKAKSWKIVDDGEEGFVDIVPGGVSSVTATTDGWNFRGGKDYVLNLYRRNDSNSKWIIAGSGLTAALNSATKVFALPGTPFMQKLLPHEGYTITSVTGLPAGLEVDMTSRRYPFVKGTAPEAGEYTYAVHLNDEAGEEQVVEIGFTVSPDLNQPVPFMGLLTWNSFEKHIDQNKVMKLADALVDFGLYDVGFDHMCIDDCWAKTAREGGRYALNPDKFYDLPALCDYVHNKGMKIGIYSDAADFTCSRAMPGSYGYEDVDAQDFVNWGFDLLKYDYCFAPADAKTAEKRYRAMYDALAKAMVNAGKKPEDFMLYMCEWGRRSPWLWGANTGATCWRSTDDTREHWTDATYHGGITDIIGVMKNIWQYNGPNRFNDADMLMVGLHGTGYSSNDGGTPGVPAGFSLDEQRTNYALWCMWSSPLTLSCNITNFDGQPNSLTGKTVTNKYYQVDLDLIRNRHLIALDQDPLGQAAEPIVDNANYIIFAKDCADGDVAISFTNLSNSKRSVKLDLSLVPGLIPGHTYAVLDLFQDAAKVGEVTTADTYTCASLTKHNTAVYRLHDITNDPLVGINDAKTSSHPAMAYDLQGRRVQDTPKGVFIMNDRRVVK